MENPSFAYQLGAVIGGFFALAMPVVFVVCLVQSFRKRSIGWIIGTVVSAIPMLMCVVGLGLAFFAGVKTGIEKAKATDSQFERVQETTIQGSDYDYSLTIPDSTWRVKRRSEAFDLIVSHRDVYVGVIPQRIRIGSNEDLRNSMIENVKKIDPEATFTESQEVEVDGLPWIHFEGRAVIQKVPVAYSYHFRSGDEGTYQIIAWTGRAFYDREKESMDKIARSFKLGEKEKEQRQPATQEKPLDLPSVHSMGEPPPIPDNIATPPSVAPSAAAEPTTGPAPEPAGGTAGQ